jgi:hypothetical protein
VTPSLHVDYKHATIKQYRKEGRALRTETTINNTRDFRIGKRLTKPARPAGGRLLRQPAPAAPRTTQPRPDHRSRRDRRYHRARHHRSRNPHPRPSPGSARSHALLAALLIFRLQPGGFTNRDLRDLIAQLRGLPSVSAGGMTYDLRRLRSHQLIERIPRSHRYRVTPTGLHTAMFLTRVHDRILPAGLAQLPGTSAPPTRLRLAATAYQAAIDDGLAA